MQLYLTSRIIYKEVACKSSGMVEMMKGIVKYSSRMLCCFY
jgi:hypothetical protein